LVVLEFTVGFEDTGTEVEAEEDVVVVVEGVEDVVACLVEVEISLEAIAAVVPGRGVAIVVEEVLRAEVKEWPLERWRLVGIERCRMDNRALCATAGEIDVVVWVVVEEVYDS
jgi:hypothetical protein